MTKPFRGCRYEVRISHLDGEQRLWSRHHSYIEALKSYRSLVAPQTRRDVNPGTAIELRDIGEDGTAARILEQGTAP